MPVPPKTCSPVQRKVWNRLYAEAERDIAAAQRVPPSQLAEMGDYARQERVRLARTDATTEACRRYDYFEFRAWTPARAWGADVPLDSAARRDWIAMGGTKPADPPEMQRWPRHLKATGQLSPMPKRRRRKR